MADIKYGSPTFLFREICKQDLFGVLANISKCRFEGVELFGMFGVEAERIRDICNEINLKIICDHVAYDEFVSNPEWVIEQRKIMGALFITISDIPVDKLPGTDGFSDAVAQIERIGFICKQSGMQLLYHNHGFDLIRKVGGKTVLELLLDATDPDCIKFQPDLGWIALGGGDPEYFLDKYRDRCRIVHLKDYYAAGPVLLGSAYELGNKRGGKEYNYFEFRPSGYGIMNFAKLIPKVLACNPEWIVTDHDLSYERDNLEEMKMSLEYIKQLVSLYH